MLRNLDVLTNEEGVLTALSEKIPTLVSKISKILICRDPLTSTSRGICYLSFDNLVDSMNTHNALKSLEPPLQIDNREIVITYCVDAENRQMSARNNGNKTHHDGGSTSKSSSAHQYTLADVPRLAEYSASVYAQNATEQDYYFKYYTEYYTEQISTGQFSSLPTMSQIGETANSGAAVALSAIQRKQQKQFGNKNVAASNNMPNIVVATPAVIQMPNGTDNRKYRKKNFCSQNFVLYLNKYLSLIFIASFFQQQHQTFRCINSMNLRDIIMIPQLVYITMQTLNTTIMVK